MNKYFHPTLYWSCDYLFTLVLKVIHVKWAPIVSRHWWQFSYLPAMPIHTTVFLSGSVTRCRRRNKTVISLTSHLNNSPNSIPGEHSETTVFSLSCFPFLKIYNSSLHPSSSDNITCSKLTSISVLYSSIGFAVHVQPPIPRNLSGKAGEVK